MVWKYCSVIPVLLGWFLKLPSLLALVFIQESFCDFQLTVYFVLKEKDATISYSLSLYKYTYCFVDGSSLIMIKKKWTFVTWTDDAMNLQNTVWWDPNNIVLMILGKE